MNKIKTDFNHLSKKIILLDEKLKKKIKKNLGEIKEMKIMRKTLRASRYKKTLSSINNDRVLTHDDLKITIYI